MEKIRKLTPLQRFNNRKKVENYKILNETMKIAVAREHLTKEEIKEYSILYIMYNYPKIVSPRIEIFTDIQFSSSNLNALKTELLNVISSGNFERNDMKNLDKNYLNLINDINQNSVIKNIFMKKDDNQQVELLNEILKELNEIKFSRKIDELENKLIKEFDEKSYSDLMQLKSQRNKE